MKELDEKDKLIIEYLMHNARLTTTKLAKLTGMTQPTIVYRMKQLEKEGYISKYDAILNLNLVKTPIEIYFINVPTFLSQEFENEIKNNPKIESLFRLANKMNYYISGFLKKEDKKQLESYFNKNKLEFKNYTQKDLRLLPFSIFNSELKLNQEINTEAHSIDIDEKDIKIINAMMDGGARDSIFKLSERTKLSDDIVLYRLKKLLKANAFPLFLAQPGTEKFNIQLDILLLSLKDITLDELTREFSKIKKTVHIIDLGRGKFFTQLLTKDFADFKDTLDKVCNALRKNLKSLEVFHTKEWVFVNRINLSKGDF